MKNKLKHLSTVECLNVYGGDCSGCNDTFWTRWGNRFADWLNAEAERVRNMDPNDDRFKYR